MKNDLMSGLNFEHLVYKGLHRLKSVIVFHKGEQPETGTVPFKEKSTHQKVYGASAAHVTWGK